MLLNVIAMLHYKKHQKMMPEGKIVHLVTSNKVFAKLLYFTVTYYLI